MLCVRLFDSLIAFPSSISVHFPRETQTQNAAKATEATLEGNIFSAVNNFLTASKLAKDLRHLMVIKLKRFVPLNINKNNIVINYELYGIMLLHSRRRATPTDRRQPLPQQPTRRPLWVTQRLHHRNRHRRTAPPMPTAAASSLRRPQRRRRRVAASSKTAAICRCRPQPDAASSRRAK